MSAGNSYLVDTGVSTANAFVPVIGGVNKG